MTKKIGITLLTFAADIVSFTAGLLLVQWLNPSFPNSPLGIYLLGLVAVLALWVGAHALIGFITKE